MRTSHLILLKNWTPSVRNTKRKAKFSLMTIKPEVLLETAFRYPEAEVQELLESKTPFVVRFKMPFDRVLNLEDIIRGKFSVNTNTLDDKVLVKNDGMPTYHFANIIDDHEMKISHVIRGEEWLPSMGLHMFCCMKPWVGSTGICTPFSHPKT